jgi:hypothetical protein
VVEDNLNFAYKAHRVRGFWLICQAASVEADWTTWLQLAKEARFFASAVFWLCHQLSRIPSAKITTLVILIENINVLWPWVKDAAAVGRARLFKCELRENFASLRVRKNNSLAPNTIDATPQAVGACDIKESIYRSWMQYCIKYIILSLGRQSEAISFSKAALVTLPNSQPPRRQNFWAPNQLN